MVPYRTAVALSLIATELVTNAFKYAYDPEEAGRVEVSVAHLPDGGVQVRVCDQGRGLPEGWAEGGTGRPQRGLGMRLIRAMLDQVGATLEVSGDGGACFTVTA